VNFQVFRTEEVKDGLNRDVYEWAPNKPDLPRCLVELTEVDVRNGRLNEAICPSCGKKLEVDGNETCH